ncbi:hypothetical protein J2Y69_000071 [Microbacterium resistens]|uniref:Uncharacterized protein n=1 Tax=Microbacterium resistens TaxID=156977 RepID=A0ABU1S790_9MICO|nr:hypothetical protein [Microbacterium resistens]MDR6865489.1 hypothetical protein [Microbacterium resistens]
MNHEEYLECMAILGYARESAEDLVWVSKDKTDLVRRRFNFVPVGDGQYEIWQSDERDLFFKASVSYGVPFVGSLEEAYLWVYKDRAGL